MTTLFERGNNKKFRFIYLSGGLAERDQKKSLWFMKENRRIRVSDLSRSFLFPFLHFSYPFLLATSFLPTAFVIQGLVNHNDVLFQMYFLYFLCENNICKLIYVYVLYI